MVNNPVVAVIMGSDSDLPVMEQTVRVLDELGLDFEMRVLSAHRSPQETHEFATTAEERGIKVIIAGAGGAAHLAGVVSSVTTLPVIGVPMPTDRAGGMDSLLSTLQMPKGIPVATMGIGKSGARNAAMLAAEILALSDPDLSAKLKEVKKNMTVGVSEANQKVQNWLEKEGLTG